MPQRRERGTGFDGGFTLVELLIVVVILGVLAGIVLPAVNSPTEDAKEATIEQILRTVRNAVEIYRAEHDRFPGYDNKGKEKEGAFVDQLTLASDKGGKTADIGKPGFPYGPYLRNEFPTNPYNGKANVKMIKDGTAFPALPDEMSGWMYKPQTGQLRCNSAVVGPQGVKVFEK